MMKALSLSALALAARLTAASVNPPDVTPSLCRVYISDASTRPHHSTRQQSLSPTAARIVLAQRAGVEAFHTHDLSDQEAITGINQYGAWTPFFEDVDQKDNIFYLIEGDSLPDSIISQLASLSPSSFEISPAPQTVAFSDLLNDFQSQKSDLLSKTNQRTDNLTVVKMPGHQVTSSLVKEIQLKRATIIVTQSGSKDTKEELLWGTYEMPGAPSHLQQRDAAFFEASLKLDPNENLAVNQVSSPAKAAKNATLAGILPACFRSQAECESMTRNCTGHGKCHLKYTDPDADDKAINKKCYSCQCSPVVTKNDKGQKVTTVWGGPACQKKDVSFQFWLIALFTVGLVSLVSFAVGTIWSMGEEELPSVIGAGVSGPVRR